MKLLIVGLGNPGDNYKKTLHNTGFMVVDELADFEQAKWQNKSKLNGFYASSNDYHFLKPETYMNKSGLAVSKALAYFKLEPGQLCVIHDDLDLNKLEYKVQFGRQSAGHRGVEDVINSIGTNQFWRIRVGIERPENDAYEIEDWVLSDYSPDDLEALKTLVPKIREDIKKIKSSSIL